MSVARERAGLLRLFKQRVTGVVQKDCLGPARSTLRFVHELTVISLGGLLALPR
jgi:hypothetical protein